MVKRALLIAPPLFLMSCETIEIVPDETAPVMFGSLVDGARLRAFHLDLSPVEGRFALGDFFSITAPVADSRSIVVLFTAEDRQSGIASIRATAHVDFACPQPSDVPRGTLDLNGAYDAVLPPGPRVPPSQFTGIDFTPAMLRNRCPAQGGSVGNISVTYSVQARNHAGIDTPMVRGNFAVHR